MKRIWIRIPLLKFTNFINYGIIVISAIILGKSCAAPTTFKCRYIRIKMVYFVNLNRTIKDNFKNIMVKTLFRAIKLNSGNVSN